MLQHSTTCCITGADSPPLGWLRQAQFVDLKRLLECKLRVHASYMEQSKPHVRPLPLLAL
jgi:hypothetical protein